MIYSFKAHDLNSRLKFDIELEKDKRVYCFLGENGAGKTQLLENLAKTLILVHGRHIVINIKNDEFMGNVVLKFGERLESAAKSIREELGQQFLPKIGSESVYGLYKYLNDVDLTKFKTAEDVKLNHSNIFCYRRGENRQYLAVDTDIRCNYPICFISAENRGYTKNLNSSPELLSDNKTLFLRAIYSLLSSMHFADEFTHESEKNKSLADWIAARSIIKPETVPHDSRRTLAEVDYLFDILSPLMPKELSLFDENGNRRIQYKPVTLYVADTPIDKLPTGAVALMHIIQEIISCYGAWNGILEEKKRIDDILQTKGIVFIDEIEAHMHPKWQAEIIPLLKKSFPRTTFYISTHSPTIVATTDIGEAYELKRDGEDVTAQLLGNPKDWYLEDIFSAGFDVRLPQKQEGENTIEDKILAFSKLAQKLMREKDEENRNKLKHNFIEKYKELIVQFEMMPDEARNDPRRDAVEQIWKSYT